MNIKRISSKLILAAIFAIPQLVLADGTQAQGVRGQATETIAINGAAKKQKPGYGLVLFLEVTEKNYDNFEEEMRTPVFSVQTEAEYRNTFDIGAGDWDRIEEFPAQAVILDGILRPSKDKFKKNEEIFYDYPVILQGMHGSENRGISVRHPVVLVSWKIRMEGKGRKGSFYNVDHLFPVFSLPFKIYTFVDRNSPMSSDIENECRNYRNPPILQIYNIKPDGRVLVFDKETGMGKSLEIGGQWERTKEMEYEGSQFEPDDKNNKWAMELYEKYAKGKTINFKTTYVIKNRGFMLMKWPEIKGNK